MRAPAQKPFCSTSHSGEVLCPFFPVPLFLWKKARKDPSETWFSLQGVTGATAEHQVLRDLTGPPGTRGKGTTEAVGTAQGQLIKQDMSSGGDRSERATSWSQSREGTTSDALLFSTFIV